MYREPTESASHAFVLRFWSEQREDDDESIEWRAILEDVNTSRRYMIEDMAPVYALLTPHWEDMELEGAPPTREQSR